MKVLKAILVSTAFCCSSCVPVQYQSANANVSLSSPAAPPHVQSTSPTPRTVPDKRLQDEIAVIATEAKGKVGAYAVEIETGKTAALDENGHYAMQSVVKVPISMTVLKMADEGRLKLDQLS